MKKHILVIALICLLLLVLQLTACSPEGTQQADTDAISEATLARYDVREIREYNGFRLDPAVGPNDNSIAGIQYVDIENYTLSITGMVDNPLTLRYEEVIAYPAFERVITLHCIQGWDATILWKGVKIADLLEVAKTQANASTIIFKAVDGYSTSIPIETIIERDMLLAYESNTAPLPPEMGYPFIVVAEDKLGYKWARWVNEIEISDDDEYKGTWEVLGYNNDAEIPEDLEE